MRFSKWTILPKASLKWSLMTSTKCFPKRCMDKHEREEAFSNDGLDKILSQSLDMFKEGKNSVKDAIDITDMFEFEGSFLVMARRREKS